MVVIRPEIKKACAQLPQTQESLEASNTLPLIRNTQASDNNNCGIWRTNCPDLLWFDGAIPNFKWISRIFTTDLGTLGCIRCCAAARQIDCAPLRVPTPLLRLLSVEAIPKAQPVSISRITTKDIHTLGWIRQVNQLPILEGPLLSRTTIAVPHPKQSTIRSVASRQVNTK